MCISSIFPGDSACCRHNGGPCGYRGNILLYIKTIRSVMVWLLYYIVNIFFPLDPFWTSMSQSLCISVFLRKLIFLFSLLPLAKCQKTASTVARFYYLVSSLYMFFHIFMIYDHLNIVHDEIKILAWKQLFSLSFPAALPLANIPICRERMIYNAIAKLF